MYKLLNSVWYLIEHSLIKIKQF